MRNVRKIPRRATRRRRKRLAAYAALALVSAGLLAFAGAVISRAEALRIEGVAVSGVPPKRAATLAALVEEELVGSYAAGILAKRNVLLLPRGRIRNELLARVPRLAAVRLSLTDGRKLLVSVSERSPKALWCRAGTGETGGDECYALDERGFAFARVGSARGEHARFIGRMPAEPVGAFVSSEEQFRSLSRFLDSLRMLGLESPVVSLRTDGEASVVLGEGARLLLRETDDLTRVFENLQSLLASPEGALRADPALAGVSYIDLRFGNKIFYRLR